MKIFPFLKWAGGKRWFVSNYTHLLPTKYNKYIEPFLGSGALFFHLKPTNAMIGDMNKDLIDTYKAIKSDPDLVNSILNKHHKNHSADYYYKVRSQIPKSLSEKAAWFIYLNRTCWNGLYRVNRNGKFNVPIGTKKNVILETDDFTKISKILKNVSIWSKDFEYLINKAQPGDFLFVDPPYTVRHNNNNFIKYNEILFSWDDQERLYFALRRAQHRKVHIISTNANHSSIINMYKNNFELIQVKRTSCISSNVSNRGAFEELIIKG
jgi:DNA adenine methylase